MFSICMYRCWIRFCCIIVVLSVASIISCPFFFRVCAAARVQTRGTGRMLNVRSYFVCDFHEIRNATKRKAATTTITTATKKKDLYKTYRYFSVFARCLHTIKTYPHIFLPSHSVCRVRCFCCCLVSACILFGSHLQRAMQIRRRALSLLLSHEHHVLVVYWDWTRLRKRVWCKRNENICSMGLISECVLHFWEATVQINVKGNTVPSLN